MGYNTTVMILNDALGSIAEDPNFGKNLVILRKSICLMPMPVRFSATWALS